MKKAFKLLFVFVLLSAFSSCGKEEVLKNFDSGYDYYKGKTLEEIVKMGNPEIWQELYGKTNHSKALVPPSQDGDTTIYDFRGKYKGISDSGGIYVMLIILRKFAIH